MPKGPVRAMLWRSAALASTVVLAAQGPAEAAGRCAFVNVGLLPGFSEPQGRCFKLDMTCPAGARYGCFKVPLQFKSGWVEKPGQPRMRELSEPFGYIDPDGVHWDMPAGAMTDGASIPLFFQPLIGGPWTDNYVKAAALHDFYIRRSSVNAVAVHKMFYLALLAAGTPQGRAQQMYGAVANFGPRWKSVDMANVEAAWRARKAALDEIVRLHKEMWEAHQENERKRDAQAAIDRALLSRPLEARTRVFAIQSDARARVDLDAFVEAAARDGILHFERDASLIVSLREQLDAELQRPASARDNVFVVRFMKTGAGTSKFSARNQAELAELLRVDAEISERLDAVVLDAIFPGQGVRR